MTISINIGCLGSNISLFTNKGSYFLKKKYMEAKSIKFYSAFSL